MILGTYAKGKGFERRRCDRCNRLRWCCQHHIGRKRNSDQIAWLCSNGRLQSLYYTDPCHQWVHDNPAKAKEEGYYTEIDSSYNKKRKSPKKWKLKKGIGLDNV